MDQFVASIYKFLDRRKSDHFIIINPAYMGDPHQVHQDFVYKCKGKIVVCEGLYVWSGSLGSEDLMWYKLRHSESILYCVSWEKFIQYIDRWVSWDYIGLNIDYGTGEDRMEMALTNIVLDLVSGNQFNLL